jgi:hypothetical protein
LFGPKIHGHPLSGGIQTFFQTFTDTHCSAVKQTMDVQDIKEMSFSAGFRLVLNGFMLLAPLTHQNWNNLR